MTIDLRSRNFQIELQNPIGGNVLDVSSVVKSFTVSNSQLDESGLILVSGTLTLHAHPLTPLAESLNPKLNPSRFARKCRVRVRIGDESGSLVRHPRGLLRILKTPKVPSRTNPEIQIQVGCLLSLQDYRQPASDDSGVTPGEEKTRTEIINALAALAKVPDLEDEIPEFPIDYPLPRLNGSYVQQMGQIAFAAGYVLWIDNQERLRAKRIPTSPTPDLTLTVGENDSTFEPLEGSETPCEVIFCTCTYPKSLPTLDPEPQYSISRDDNYSPSDISLQQWSGMGTTTPVSYRRSRRPKGLILPETYPESPSLATAEEEYSTDYFEETERGFLTKRVQSVYQPRGVLMPQFYPGDLQEIVGVRTETYYTYEEDVPTIVTTYTYEPQGVIDPTNASLETRSLLGKSGWSQDVYRKVNNGWTKRTTSRSFKVGDSSPASGSTFSSAGNNQPSAPEQRQQPYYLEDTQVTGKARYGEVGGNFDERKRTFEVQTASTKAQLDYLAGLIGRRVWGQVNGVSFGFDLRDEFNGANYEPLQVVDWIELDDATGDAVKSRYLVTGEAFALSGRQCAIAADGLNLGIVSESGVISPPYQVKGETTGALLISGGFNVYPYPVTTEPESFGGTLLISGGFGEGEGTPPTHHYPLDSTAWEDIIAGFDLIQSGTVTVVGGAARFNGSSFLYYSGDTPTDFAAFDFSGNWRVTFDIYFASLPDETDQGIAETNGDWTLRIDGFTYGVLTLAFEVKSGDGGDPIGLATIPASSITTGEWHSVELIVAGTTATLKVDAIEATGTITGDRVTETELIQIFFGVANSSNLLSGSRIDEIKIYL